MWFTLTEKGVFSIDASPVCCAIAVSAIVYLVALPASEPCSTVAYKAILEICTVPMQARASMAVIESITAISSIAFQTHAIESCNTINACAISTVHIFTIVYVNVTTCTCKSRRTRQVVRTANVAVGPIKLLFTVDSEIELYLSKCSLIEGWCHCLPYSDAVSDLDWESIYQVIAFVVIMVHYFNAKDCSLYKAKDVARSGFSFCVLHGLAPRSLDALTRVSSKEGGIGREASPPNSAPPPPPSQIISRLAKKLGVVRWMVLKLKFLGLHTPCMRGHILLLHPPPHSLWPLEPWS